MHHRCTPTMPEISVLAGLRRRHNRSKLHPSLDLAEQLAAAAASSSRGTPTRFRRRCLCFLCISASSASPLGFLCAVCLCKHLAVPPRICTLAFHIGSSQNPPHPSPGTRDCRGVQGINTDRRAFCKPNRAHLAGASAHEGESVQPDSHVRAYRHAFFAPSMGCR